MKKIAFLTAVIAVLSYASCKQRDDESDVKDSSARRVPCQLEKNWAGRMGMKLEDTSDSSGAMISCVVEGEGLHHIGLEVGDKIVALNRNTKVSSAQGFEAAAKTLVIGRRGRIRHWEFAVLRNGQRQQIKPLARYSGCGIYVFDDCGPLAQ